MSLTGQGLRKHCGTNIFTRSSVVVCFMMQHEQWTKAKDICFFDFICLIQPEIIAFWLQLLRNQMQVKALHKIKLSAWWLVQNHKLAYRGCGINFNKILKCLTEVCFISFLSAWISTEVSFISIKSFWHCTF